ncbi:MAG: polysaccharide deacetylase family protein [Clostridia bacterium]|jgi:hypothetical protein|nr:polysaccharide deacetylase family protein [Clostridia bacterium]
MQKKRKESELAMYKIETEKDRRKVCRTILEALFLFLLLFLILRALFVFKKYEPYNESAVSGEDHGFIALSYFGVDREGTDSLVATKRLKEELTALKALGYVTITQNDIDAYYNEGKPLPDKALFLMFEDGRKDTVLFAEKLLEAENYKASILTYAEKFENNDEKFVSPNDLKHLEKEGFWELGTNGYRLSYINTYDRYKRYLGELESREFVEINQYIDRNYNHYLMDYIRDKDGIPTESTQEMRDRITTDYDLMEEIYNKDFGYMPGLYVLMHSNTGRFGNNAAVSEVNADNLQGLFDMNFNREGYSYNDTSSSIYDLTRLQPQAWWYTNHLLMRIKDDLPEKDRDNIVFVTGDPKGLKDWELEKGAVEYKKNLIALTSESMSNGILKLKNEDCQNIHLTTELLGNKIGKQAIYLRTDGDMNSDSGLNSYISVSVENNILYVREKNDGKVNTLVTQDLFELEDDNPVSVEKDNIDALAAELNVRGKFAQNDSFSLLYRLEALEAKKNKARSVSEGAEEYIPEIQIQDPGDRKLDLTIDGDKLTLTVDGRMVANQITMNRTDGGGIYLESAFGGYGKSQRNIADDVYDGAFKYLKITAADNSAVYYDNTLHGFALFADAWTSFWNKIIDWFITNL